MKKTTAEVIRVSAGAIGGGTRSQITEISRSSIKNAVEILTNAEPELNSMLVCTYPETCPDDGRVVKCHWRRMLNAIERKFGPFSYFTAFEYQARGAPHFHVGLSISLADLGEVDTLQRRKISRRRPTFQTVKEVQDWAFGTWVDIISKADPVHNGVQLDWVGLDDDDILMMETAYHHYNAGFSWEVMRDKDGAKKYFVKELTGLKQYQKRIPQGYSNPGRHFLYSDDMRFDPDNALEFAVSDGELRVMLERAGWEWLPDRGKPLYKRLWNAAAGLAVQLIQNGYQPISEGIRGLRRFADLRAHYFGDKQARLWRNAADIADFKAAWETVKHWQNIKRKLAYEDYWQSIFATGPP